MLGLDVIFQSWGLIALQLVGLSTVLLARLPIPHRLGMIAFTICLLALGAATFITFTYSHAGWAPCSTCFGIMIVGAIFESSPKTVTAGI